MATEKTEGPGWTPGLKSDGERTHEGLRVGTARGAGKNQEVRVTWKKNSLEEGMDNSVK